MTLTSENKDARIEFKTSSELKELLQNAAGSLGMDLSSFLISTATQRAKEILRQDQMLTLAQREWEALEEKLTHPPAPTQELKELMELEGFDE